jgi:flagellar biogenesis protein FliO
MEDMKSPIAFTAPEIARPEIIPTMRPGSAPLAFHRVAAFALGRLQAFWRALVSRTGSKRKLLSVRESAALGDRRFVAVVEFERQRFLIGSSPASVTLLAQLPDRRGDREPGGEPNREHRGERN